jgi:hypothetical protein
MTVEIDEHFDLLGVLLLLSPEVRDDAFQFWEQMIALGIFVSVPMTIEIVPLHSRSIVSQDNSIDVDHWQKNPTDLVGILNKFINKTLHHPRTNTLSGMLPSHHDNNCLAICILVYNKGFDLIPKDGSGNLHPKEGERFVDFAVSVIGVRRLRTELDLIITVLEVVLKAELVIIRL